MSSNMKYVIFSLIYCLVSVFAKDINDNPDIGSSALDIIARHGYPAEAHTIATKDDYLLTVHRIPYSKYSNNTKNRQPIFIQHGLSGCSADWLLNANKSLAFILSDAGYDVWLGNARGNKYSRSHIHYRPDDAEFWNFSWHEMGIYDLPAVLDFVGTNTQKKGEIIYIGHSMGTSMFFVYASTYKNVTDTVKMMVALAPVSYMSDVKSPIKYLAPWANDIEWLAEHLGLNEFLPSNKIMKYLISMGCDHATTEMHLCEDVIFLLVGFDKEEFDMKLLPLILSQSPSGTSTKSVVHYAQEINAGGPFQQFDYGSKENLIRYNSSTPPSYKLSDITVPLYLISASNDWLAGPKDVSKLLNSLPKTVKSYVVPLKNFNHIDFLWAKDAPDLVYKNIIKEIKKFA